MALPHVAQGDPHVAAHNDERDAIDAAQSYAVQRVNHIGTESADVLTDGTTNKAYLATERTKLAGVATGATANSPDATLLARANHTGTQPVSTVTGLAAVATSGAYSDLTGTPAAPGAGSTPDTVIIFAGDHGTLDPTGAADNAGILRACYAQALAAFASGAKSTDIVFPSGTFRMSSNGVGNGSAVGAMVLRAISGGHTGTVRVRGQGVAATTFKMTTTSPTLVSTDKNDNASVFGNIIFSDFTVDRNSITGVGRTAVFAITGGNYTIDRVTLERVNIINMGAPGFTVTSGVVISSSASVWNPSTWRTVTNITIRDCDFKGGNYGVSIQSLNSTLATTGINRDASLLAGGMASGVFFDNIIIERFSWDSGCTNFAPVNAAGDSAGVMLGSGGVLGRVRLTDCVSKGSLDVGYEVDTAYDCIMTRCYSEDALNSHFYHRPTFAGAPDLNAPVGAVGPAYDRLNFAMIDCSARNNKLAGTAQGTTLSSGNAFNKGFYIHAKDYGLMGGNVVIRNFNYFSNGPQGLYATSAWNRINGGFRNIDIDNVRVEITGVDVNQTYGVTTSALFIDMRVGRGKIRVRNMTQSLTGQHSGTGAITFTGLSLRALADYVLDIEGYHSRCVVDTVGSATKPNYTEVATGGDWSSPGNFSGGTLVFEQGWRSDLGSSGQSLADFAVNLNVLSLNTPGTTEYRLTQVCDEDQTDYNYGSVGPVTDQNTSLGCTPPATVTSSYKQGVRLKVDAKTGTQSIHCYVAYNGTNYVLNIDTEVAGVLTNRASTVIGASVTSPFWVRGKIRDNVVTAEYLTATTTSTVLPAPGVTVTYTVNATDGTLALFGSQGDQGYPGIVWVPVDSGSTSRTMVNYFMSVVSGRIANVSALHVRNTGGVNVLKNSSNNAASTWRNRRILELPEWDLGPYAAVGLSSTPWIVDPTLLATMRSTRWNYLTPPAAITITPSGSPFTWTNQTGMDQDVSVYGGTVTNVSVTRVGGTAVQVASTSGVVVRLAPGASVTVTYSVAPTMTALPVL